jgi:hypothetical protein
MQQEVDGGGARSGTRRYNVITFLPSQCKIRFSPAKFVLYFPFRLTSLG